MFWDQADPAKELFERDLVLEIRGSKKERRRAKKYAEGKEPIPLHGGMNAAPRLERNSGFDGL